MNGEFLKLESAVKDDGQRIEVEATVARDEVAQAIRDFYRLMARVKCLDETDGEALKTALERVVGKEDLLEACKDFVLNRFTVAAIRRLNIDTPLTPGVHADESPCETGDFSFAISVTPRPELSLTSAELVRIAPSSLVVEERDVDEQVLYVAEQFAKFEPADHAALAEGDWALVDIEVVKNGKIMKELSGTRRSVEVVRGKVPEGFIAGVEGMEAGSIRKVSFEVARPSSQVGLQTTCEDVDSYTADVVLHEVQQRTVAVVDDAWVADFLPQFGTLEGFRASIRADLEDQKRRADQQDMVYKVRAALAKRLRGTVPDEMYEVAKESLIKQTMAKIEGAGSTLEDYCAEHGITKDAFNMNVFLQASEYLGQNLALDILAWEKGFTATDEEVLRAKEQLPGGMGQLSDAEFERRGLRSLLPNILAGSGPLPG